MKVVVAIDSLKGSLSSMEAGEAARTGILRAFPDAQIIVRPLADGGEGTTDAFIDGCFAEPVTITVTGPDGRPVQARYGWQKEQNTAVMEMAAAAGITLVKKEDLDPMTATTRGLGEMILDAAARGCRQFILGIGGSATNDGGIGMLTALGCRFTDAQGRDAGEGAQALLRTAAVSLSGMAPVLSECRFTVACDVTNPLCGREGATLVYGPQKGVEPELAETLDRGMEQYARLIADAAGRDYKEVPGAGAAGGLGFALISCLNAHLAPGADMILEALGLERDLEDADFFVTGEGRLDHQTAMGKAPVRAAALAATRCVPALAFAGAVSKEASACNEAGILAYFPIVRGVTDLENAMRPENAAANMADSTEQVFRLIRQLY